MPYRQYISYVTAATIRLMCYAIFSFFTYAPTSGPFFFYYRCLEHLDSSYINEILWKTVDKLVRYNINLISFQIWINE